MVTKKTCIKCKKSNVLVNLPHIKDVCDSCFAKIIEKRVRKYIRINKIFRKNDRILIIDNLSFFLVKGIIKELPAKISLKNMDIRDLSKKAVKNKLKKDRINKVVILWTLDDEANLFLDNLFAKKNKRLNKKYIRLLVTITDKEAGLFAKINKIDFKENKKNNDIKKMLDTLEQKYPETKFSLLRSGEQMKEILNKK